MLFIILQFAYATSLNINTGLWLHEMEVYINGKKLDPEAILQQTLQQIPEAQRALLKDAIKEQMQPVENEKKQCITTNLLKKDNVAKLIEDNDECRVRITNFSPSSMSADINCKDGGGKGNMTWKANSKTSYTFEVNMVAEGEKIRQLGKGKFLSSNCGNIKPVK